MKPTTLFQLHSTFIYSNFSKINNFKTDPNFKVSPSISFVKEFSIIIF